MKFDPFVPGPFSVGTRSGLAIDRDRDSRQLPFQTWIPQDNRAGRHPLVLYSHASGGHARQSAYLSSHLASHGYVVAAADHTGNTAADFAERAKRVAAGETLTPAESDVRLRQVIADRVPDIRFLLDQMLICAPDQVLDRIDDERAGLIGWSFGGWAALSALEVDDRFGAVVALAPAGNSKPLPGIIPAMLTFVWKREVPTLFLAAECDRFTPLAGQYELFERTPSRKRMFVLGHADHQHFADQIDEPGLCAPEQAHLFTRGLALAHFEAVLNGNAAAQEFLNSDPAAILRARGVDVVEHKHVAD